MMHYALSESKCLLHHARFYREGMGTANDRLRQARSAKYATAVDAAQAMGIKPPTYIQHENGTRGSGSIPRAAAQRYAAFFRVSLDWLLTGKGEGPDATAEPSVEDLEQMIREIVDGELTVPLRLADLPHIFAPALHEQLERFRSDRASQQGGGTKSALGKGAQSLSPTKQAD